MQARWILPDGREVTADVPEGTTLMEAAVANDVPGIEGACGGCLSCATCHVIVAPDWAARLGPVGDFEDAMLDTTEVARSPASRLSCQITMGAALDGITLTVPGE